MSGENKVTDKIIRSLIKKYGKITFKTFMETALFAREHGYYTSRATTSLARDYYTSPNTHPIFGSLIAVQLEQIWREMDCVTPFHIIEVGAGSGSLGTDILSYSSTLSAEFRNAIEYISIDVNPRGPSSGNMHKIRALGLPLRNIVGCILSNELIDSFPVHRFTIQNGTIQEIYVTLDGNEELTEILDSPSTRLIEDRIANLNIILPEGFIGEVCTYLETWTKDIRESLEKGFIITIDYGEYAHDLYSNIRNKGTLRSFYRHTQVNNPYFMPGEQDITTDVDFTSLISVGEYHSIKSVGITTQREFLYNLGFQKHLNTLSHMGLSQRDLDSNRMAMLDLVKPGEMGDFKVLAQLKGISFSPILTGFLDRELSNVDPGKNTILTDTPLLTSNHINLMDSKYPHLDWDWESLWPFGTSE